MILCMLKPSHTQVKDLTMRPASRGILNDTKNPLITLRRGHFERSAVSLGVTNLRYLSLGFRLCSLVSLFFVGLVLTTPAYADVLETIRAKGVLRVGVSGDYQPFTLCTADSIDCRGFDIEVAKRVAADLGVRLELVRFRWPELRADLAAGKFDVAMSGVTLRPERALIATFTRPYTVAQAVVLVADREQFPSLATVDQPGVRVAVNAGGHLEQVARTYFRTAIVQPTAKNLSLPDVVVSQQAEALLTDSLEAPHFLASHPTLSALPGFGRDRKVYLLRRGDVAFRDWLDAWMLAREAEGVLPLLRTRWFGKDAQAAPHSLSALFAYLDLRLALMPAVADYKRRFNLSVTDEPQERAILEQIETQAHESQLDEQKVQQLFRIQIELAKQVQHAFLREQQPLFVFPSWARGLDLATDLRPILLELSSRIVHELARTIPALQARATVLQLTDKEITIPILSTEDRLRLGEALWAIGQARKKREEHLSFLHPSFLSSLHDRPKFGNFISYLCRINSTRINQ